MHWEHATPEAVEEMLEALKEEKEGFFENIGATYRRGSAEQLECAQIAMVEYCKSSFAVENWLKERLREIKKQREEKTENHL